MTTRKEIIATALMVNWCVSFIGLAVDTEGTPLWAVASCYGWFMLSSLGAIWVQKSNGGTK